MCNVCELSPCSNSCPNNRSGEQQFFCPICGEELGDETYVFISTAQIIGCPCCINAVSYDKLYGLFDT